MNIIIGSTSERKIKVAEKIAKQFFDEIVEISGFPAKSNVPNTPYDNQTYDGARNRAIDCRKNSGGADLYVGLESGLINRYGHMFEEAWACVIDNEDNEYYGYSSGLKVPDYIVEKMAELKIEHCDLMYELEKESDDLRDSDTWHSYSGGLIAREVSLEESIRNAFIQIFAPSDSFYKK